MSYKSMPLSGFTVEFLLEPSGMSRCPHLQIDLVSCQLGGWRPQNLITARTSVVDQSFQSVSEDCFLLGDLERLKESLMHLQKGANGAFQFFTEDRSLILEFRPNEIEDDIIIACQMPPETWHYDVFLKRDPFLFRKTMKHSLKFEFWMERKRLSQPIAQMEHFLNFYTNLDPQLHFLQ